MCFDGRLTDVKDAGLRVALSSLRGLRECSKDGEPPNA